MPKSRTVTHVGALEKGDVIEIPGHALNSRSQEPVLAYVDELFYGPATPDEPAPPVLDLLVYPLLPPGRARQDYPFHNPVPLINSGLAGLPPGLVFVPVAQTVRNNANQLAIRRNERLHSRRTPHMEGLVQLAGSFDANHPDNDAIFAATQSGEDRLPRDRMARLDWDRIQTEVGSKGKFIVDQEEKALQPRRAYTRRKENPKKRGRKKQNVLPGSIFDLTMDEVVRIFNPGEGIKALFNTLAARPETKNLTLQGILNLADKHPKELENKTALANTASLESVAARGLIEDGGYLGSPGLLSFIEKVVTKKAALAQEDPQGQTEEARKYAQIKTFAHLAAMSKEDLWTLVGIGPRNLTHIRHELSAALARLPRETGTAPARLGEVIRDLKSIRGAFITEASAIGTERETAAIREKYQDPQTRGKDVPPRYIHRKVQTPS